VAVRRSGAREGCCWLELLIHTTNQMTTTTTTWVVAGSTVVAAAAAALLAYRLGTRRAYRELQSAKQMMNREKLSRVRAEQLIVQKTVLAGEITVPFIGSIRTMFPKRFGTPRQGALAENSLGVLQLSSVMGDGALDGLESFSHAWLLFYFHENSNEHKLNAQGGAKTFKTKIRAPGLLGAKTGVLSTRSPHRPSRLGLSLVRIVNVDSIRRRVLVSGVDLLDETPIFDIKPFVPADVPSGGEVKYPEWVAKRMHDGRSSEDAPLVVKFTSEAKEVLADIIKRSEYTRMFLSEDLDHACNVLSEALRLDVRAVFHGRYDTSGKREFRANFCDVSVLFTVEDLDQVGGNKPILKVVRCEYDVAGSVNA
jgi:tRNA-Thr(GGU) m(6)t(6)A37 methyltransferase TsaA